MKTVYQKAYERLGNIFSGGDEKAYEEYEKFPYSDEKKLKEIRRNYKRTSDYGKEKADEEMKRDGVTDEKPAGIWDYLNQFKKHDNPNEDILYKENKNIPQSEIEAASKYAWFESKDKDLNSRITQKVSSWYDDVFGKEGAAEDATGKLISPQAKFKLQEEKIPLLSKDGNEISDSYHKLAAFMADRENKKATPAGNFALQQALNKFSYLPQLKEDGNIGPKTASRLKQTLVKQGLSALIKNFA